MVQIFINLKNPPSLARFEPMNLGSNGKHATTKPLRATLSDVTICFLCSVMEQETKLVSDECLTVVVSHPNFSFP
jgi:hypothetical protein